MKLSDRITKAVTWYAQVSGRDIVIPRYFMGGFEMDVCCIKSSGYVYEYEIKISRQDFFADFKKEYGFYNPEKKHDRIQNGDRVCNKFFFVVPEGLVTVDEVPGYAGLIYFEDHKYGGRCRCVKAAKLIHRTKFTDWERVARKLSFRETNIRRKLRYIEFDKIDANS